MFSEELELLVEAALKDGEISEKELAVLHKRAQAEGFDIDEFDLLLEARITDKQKEMEEDEAELEKSKEPSALTKLLNRIEEINNTKFKGSFFGATAAQKKTEALVGAIRGFQLPNDKTELLEITQFLKPYGSSSLFKRALDDSFDIEMAAAYKDRYKEAVAKIKSQFSDCPELMEAITDNKKGLFGGLFGK